MLLFVCSLVRSLLVFLGGGGLVMVYGERKPARSRAPVWKAESPENVAAVAFCLFVGFGRCLCSGGGGFVAVSVKWPPEVLSQR